MAKATLAGVLVTVFATIPAFVGVSALVGVLVTPTLALVGVLVAPTLVAVAPTPIVASVLACAAVLVVRCALVTGHVGMPTLAFAPMPTVPALAFVIMPTCALEYGAALLAVFVVAGTRTGTTDVGG